jgi:hypothetical protein
MKRNVAVSVQMRVANSLQLSLSEDCGGASASPPAGVHLASSGGIDGRGDDSAGVDGDACADDGRGAMTLRAMWTAAGPRRVDAALAHTTLSVADGTAQDGKDEAVSSPQHRLLSIGSLALGSNSNTTDGGGGGGGDDTIMIAVHQPWSCSAGSEQVEGPSSLVCAAANETKRGSAGDAADSLLCIE